MPSPLGLIRRFGGNVIGNATSYAMGAATADSLRPELQELVNATWKLHPVRPPAVGTLALGVAQGQVDAGQAAEWAAEQGFGGTQFAALVDVANTGPGVPVAFDLWRRGIIDEAGFRRAAKRQGLEAEWVDDLVRIKLSVLDQAQLANAIHRGLIPDPGLLLGHTPGAGKVPAYPVYQIDALAEALAHGFDRDHLGVLVGLAGLPMGTHEAAQAVFRGVIDKEDFYRAVAQGNTRNEWADAIFDQSRQILTATEAINLRLRGWLDTDEEMYAITRAHGMTDENAHLLYLVQGRPITPRQVFIGQRRGGHYDGPIDQIEPAFLSALRQSNIRPEWYNLEWAQRYTYPSTFVLRSLAQAGDLTQAETEQILLYEGWEPTLAAKVTARWAGGTGTTPTADPLVKKAQGGLYTATHRAYVVSDAAESQARANLAAIGATAAAQDEVLRLWNLERDLVRADLSRSDVRKEYMAQAITEAEAIARLMQLGYSQAEATAYLHIA